MSSRDVEEKHLYYELSDDQLSNEKKEDIRMELRQNNEVSNLYDNYRT